VSLAIDAGSRKRHGRVYPELAGPDPARYSCPVLRTEIEDWFEPPHLHPSNGAVNTVEPTYPIDPLTWSVIAFTTVISSAVSAWPARLR